MSDFQFDIVSPGSPLWEQAFRSLPDESRDVFYHPGYAGVFAETVNSCDEVLAAIGRSGGETMLYPFVLRKLESASNGTLTDDDGYDICGYYGRNGLVGTAGIAASLPFFWARFTQWAVDMNVLCSFDRFHPVMKNHQLTDPGCRRIDVGSFVVVDLSPSYESIERSFKHSLRKEIRKGDRAGVEVFIEQNTDSLEYFLNIYEDTLKRNNARYFYYFDREYYLNLAKNVPNNFSFFYGKVNGEIHTVELVLFEGQFSHSFLGGTTRIGLSASANQILKRAILKRMKDLGCRYFLLGGGQSPDDGIFRYKQAYAPEGLFSSYVGGVIFEPDRYDDVRLRWETLNERQRTPRLQFYDPN